LTPVKLNAIRTLLESISASEMEDIIHLTWIRASNITMQGSVHKFRIVRQVRTCVTSRPPKLPPQASLIMCESQRATWSLCLWRIHLSTHENVSYECVHHHTTHLCTYRESSRICYIGNVSWQPRAISIIQPSR